MGHPSGGATAIYNSSALAYYRHSDWLGSSRLTSTAGRALYSSMAYAPFGEQYATSGTPDPSFTGQNSDTVASLYDFTFREHSPSQGRWISPDPAGLAAVDPTNPQTWNRYAYVANSPLSYIDPLGLFVSECWWYANCDAQYFGTGGGGGGGNNGFFDGSWTSPGIIDTPLTQGMANFNAIAEAQYTDSLFNASISQDDTNTAFAISGITSLQSLTNLSLGSSQLSSISPLSMNLQGLSAASTEGNLYPGDIFSNLYRVSPIGLTNIPKPKKPASIMGLMPIPQGFSAGCTPQNQQFLPSVLLLYYQIFVQGGTTYSGSCGY